MKNYILTAIILFVFCSNKLLADDPKLKFQLFFGGAISIKKYDVGAMLVPSNMKIKFLPGGTLEYGALIGCRLNEKNEINVEMYNQTSGLVPMIDSLQGKFSKIIVQPNYFYIIRLNHIWNFNCGLGIRYAINTKFDIDGSKLPNGGHNVYYYKGSFGFALSPQLEAFSKKKRVSFIFGTSIYYNEFSIDYMTSNGQYINVNNLPKDLYNLIHIINGSGVDITLSLCFYFNLKRQQQFYEN